MASLTWIDETPHVVAKDYSVISRSFAKQSSHDNPTSIASLVNETSEPRPKIPKRRPKAISPTASTLGLDNPSSLPTLPLTKLLLKEPSAKRKRAVKSDPDATNILPTLEAKKRISQRLDELLQTNLARCHVAHARDACSSWDPPISLSQNMSSCQRFFWRETQGFDAFYSAAAYSVSDFQIDVYLIQTKRESAGQEEACDPSPPSLTVAAERECTVEPSASCSEHPALPLSVVDKGDVSTRQMESESQFLDAQRSSIRDYYDHLMKAKEMDLNTQIEALIATHQSWVETMVAERDRKLACLL